MLYHARKEMCDFVQTMQSYQPCGGSGGMRDAKRAGDRHADGVVPQRSRSVPRGTLAELSALRYIELKYLSLLEVLPPCTEAPDEA